MKDKFFVILVLYFVLKKAVSNKPVPKPSPAQVMMNRYKMMQDKILQAEQENKEKMKARVREISQQNAIKASTSVSYSTLLYNAYR